MSAVPWWAWAILATLTGAGGGIVALCLRAPDEHDVWDGGEPREVRGIRVVPGREPW